MLVVIAGFATVSNTYAQLNYPVDVAVSGDDILVADLKLPGIQKISKDGGLSVVYKGTSKFRTPLNGVRCVVTNPEGKIVVGDSATRQIYIIEGGKPKPLLTNKIGIGVPYAMVYDQKGNLFVADLEQPGRIFKVPAGKTVPEVFAVESGVRGLAIDKNGDLIAVTGQADALVKFAADGKKSVILGNRPFRFPNSVAVKGDDIFVCDSYKKCVWKIDSAGKATEFCKSGITYPGGLAVQGDNLLVTDSKSKKIFSISADGTAKEVPIK